MVIIIKDEQSNRNSQDTKSTLFCIQVFIHIGIIHMKSKYTVAPWVEEGLSLSYCFVIFNCNAYIDEITLNIPPGYL